MAYNFSIAPVFHIMIAEMLPDIGISLLEFANQIDGLVVSFLFPILSSPNLLGMAGVFYIFGGILLAGKIFIHFGLPET